MKRIFDEEINKKYRPVKKMPKWLIESLSIAMQVKTLRQFIGMTQLQLAKRVGVDSRIIRRIENEEIGPNVSLINKIAKAMNCELRVTLIPREDVLKYLNRLAQVKAEKIVKSSVANAAIEMQRPSLSVIKQQITTVKQDILKNKRQSLWSE
jgi:transcriptional regulator with XRE-family HTH domain